jgi:hypothetical protein
MFGSISFGIASSLVGAIADWTKDMNAIFYVYATSSIFFILVAGNTFFKAEKVELIGGSRPFLTRTSSRSSGFRASPSIGSETVETNPDSDGSRARRKIVSRFSVQDPDIESDEDDLLPIRENEIQRLVQFATESSIIEAVNLSNPPASRRRSSAGGDNMSIDSSYSSLEPIPTTFLELIKQPQVFLFFITMMLMGVAINMVVSFFFIFLRDELEASSTLTGMTGLVGAATELLFFFYSRDVSTIEAFSHRLCDLQFTHITLLLVDSDIWNQKFNNSRPRLDHCQSICLHSITKRRKRSMDCSGTPSSQW